MRKFNKANMFRFLVALVLPIWLTLLIIILVMDLINIMFDRREFVASEDLFNLWREWITFRGHPYE